MSVFKEVKKINIKSIIERYYRPPEKRGGRYTVLCPFHDEKTPSLFINTEKNYFKCFGCGEGGDGVSFVSKMLGLRPIEAAITIAADFGIAVNIRRGGPLPRKERKEIRARQRKRKINKALEKWASESYVKLAHFRRCLFYALATPQDYFEHPEHIFALQYVDYILDVLQFGSEKNKRELLVAHLQGRLGLTGRWIA